MGVVWHDMFPSPTKYHPMNTPLAKKRKNTGLAKILTGSASIQALFKPCAQFEYNCTQRYWLCAY